MSLYKVTLKLSQPELIKFLDRNRVSDVVIEALQNDGAVEDLEPFSSPRASAPARSRERAPSPRKRMIAVAKPAPIDEIAAALRAKPRNGGSEAQRVPTTSASLSPRSIGCPAAMPAASRIASPSACSTSSSNCPIGRSRSSPRKG